MRPSFLFGFFAVMFILLVSTFLVSAYKSEEIRTDMATSLNVGDCIRYLHVLGLSQNGWYKLNNLFIFSNGVEENAKVLVRESCDRSPIVPDWGEENLWSIEYILEDVERYYNDFYKDSMAEERK